MNDTDALARLTPYLRDAISKQDPHIADQLWAAVRDGRTRLEFDTGDEAPVVVLLVDGNRLAEVDLRNITDEP